MISTATRSLREPPDIVPLDGLAEVRQGIVDLAGELRLRHGGCLSDVRLAWRLAGVAQAPVVLVLGGISSHRVVYSLGEAQGWWDGMVGPGRAVDSRNFQILGVDFLGGSRESSGPVGNESFPSVSTYDQAAVIRRLLEHLKIPALHAIVGASYGGMVALAFAEEYPDQVQRLCVIGAADRTHPMSTAWRCVQRRILRYALRHGEGAQGVELARALAMATYRSPAEFSQRFDTAPCSQEAAAGACFEFPVERYLFARGADYAAQYNAAAFLCLSESIDLHAVNAERIITPTTLVSIAEDQLVPAADVSRLRERLAGPARLVQLHSLYGHDAFLKEIEQVGPVVGEVLAGAV